MPPSFGSDSSHQMLDCEENVIVSLPSVIVVTCSDCGTSTGKGVVAFRNAVSATAMGVKESSVSGSSDSIPHRARLLPAHARRRFARCGKRQFLTHCRQPANMERPRSETDFLTNVRRSASARETCFTLNRRIGREQGE